MLLINLPTPQQTPIPFFTSGVDLDAITVTLQFRFHVTDGYWYMRVLDDVGQTIIMADRRIVAEWPLYASLTVRTPPGLFIVRDTTGQGIAPQLDSFGKRWLFGYFTQADLAAFGIV